MDPRPGMLLAASIVGLLCAFGQARAGPEPFESGARFGALAPLVWVLPGGEPLACGNELLPFDFDPRQRGYDSRSAFWMMWMAMRSFESGSAQTRAELASVGFDRYVALDNPFVGTQGFVAGSREAVIVAMRGSVDWIDYLVDFHFFLQPGAPWGFAGRVHSGFANALSSVWGELERAVTEMTREGQVVWLTGHSMGGALATLAAARLVGLGVRLGPLYTFAAPRPGDEELCREVSDRLQGELVRVVHGNDLVPRLPPTSGAAESFSELLPLGLGKRFAQKLVREMRFAHPGSLLLLPATEPGLLSAQAAMDEDVSYWRDLTLQAAPQNFIEFIIALSRRQTLLHNEKSYLCQLEQLLFP